MAATTSYPGLCATCDQAPDCGWRGRNGDRPVFHCEEFLCGPGGTAGPCGARTGVAVAVQTFDPPPRGRDKGLCVNCDNRCSCTFRIPEGGVWRCEEYR